MTARAGVRECKEPSAPGEGPEEALSDRGSTPLASIKRKPRDCYEITRFSLFLAKYAAKKYYALNRVVKFTPNFTPYRSETALNRPSIRSCESFRIVFETVMYVSIVKALE